MDVARLLDGEVALIDRPVALATKPELLFEAGLGEEALRVLMRPVVEGCVDAVADEDGEADLLERISELASERLLVGVGPLEESGQIASLHLVHVIERLAVVRFRQVVGLRFVDLVVADEVPVRGVDVFGLAHRTGASINCFHHGLLAARGGKDPLSSWYDFQHGLLGSPHAGSASGKLFRQRPA